MQIPIAADYIDKLKEAGSNRPRGWKSQLARDYLDLAESIGERPTEGATQAHLSRILTSKTNCSLQTYLWMAHALDLEVRLVSKKRKQ